MEVSGAGGRGSRVVHAPGSAPSARSTPAGTASTAPALLWCARLLCLPWVMTTNQRIIAATAAAIAGLFLAGCDNTETEDTPEAPADTSAPVNETGGVGEGDEADGPDNETGGVGDGDLGENEGADGPNNATGGVGDGDLGGDDGEEGTG
jgi:hypothetical protein